MDFEDANTLTYGQRDTNGLLPDLHDKGKRYKHVRTGKTYIILGWSWNGDTDTWHVLHKEDTEIITTFTRSITNFYGRNEHGVRRFVKVD